MVRRLIQNNHLRFLRQCSGDQHALLLSSGKRQEAALQKFIHANHAKRLLHNLPVLIVCRLHHFLARIASHLHDFSYRKVKVCFALLRNDRQTFCHLPIRHFNQALSIQ